MIVTTKTTVSFRMPQEWEAHDKFTKSHRMSDWTMEIAGNYYAYTKVQTISSEVKEDN